MRTLLLAACLVIVSAIDGTWYCSRGFVMDTLCIDLGTLLDKPSLRSLANPDKHSIHCVVDVGACVASGYQVLVKPSGYTQGDDYIQDVKLDSAGNALVVAAARKVGVCGTCAGTGTQVQGYSATVIGYLDSGAIPGSKNPKSTGNADPPILRVVELLPFATPCPEAPAPGSTQSPNNPSPIPSPKPILVISLPLTPSPTSKSPTASPTSKSPTAEPTSKSPTRSPTSKSPTMSPTSKAPTMSPTSKAPTMSPTSKAPTMSPTSKSPTMSPTSESPTNFPTSKSPTMYPSSSALPSQLPSVQPIHTPSSTPSTSSKPPIGDEPVTCFPGDAICQVEGKGHVPMRTLKLGDKVLVHSGEYESIYSFGHYDQDIDAKYLSFMTSARNVLEVSMDHLVFTEGRRCVPASKIIVGDTVEIASGGLVTVTSISVVWKKGAFAPFTDSGTVIVNGVKASSFIAFQNSSTLEIAGIDTGLDFHFLAHTFERPYRFWCRHLSSCLHEQYTIEGLSQRLTSTHSAARWYFNKSKTSRVTALLFAIPFLLYIAFLAYPTITLCLVLVLPLVLAINSQSITFHARRAIKMVG